MSRPEVGKAYRISRNVIVKDISDHLTVLEKGGMVTTSYWDWEEIEPEYELGALYLSDTGHLFKRLRRSQDGSLGWAFYEDTKSRYFGDHMIHDDNWPKRPMERVYRESEVSQ